MSLSEDLPIGQRTSNPEKNFERLWQTFDRNYGIFGPKKLDWDALYKLYRPKVTPETTDDELFNIMASLLGHLNDNHVAIRSENPPRFYRSGILGNLKEEDLSKLELEDFSLDLVKEKYLKGQFKKRVKYLDPSVFHYGWLTDQIGYCHLLGFGFPEQSTAAIDEIIQEFKDANGIIIDVRFNRGGSDTVGKIIADRFADRKRLYMKTQIRNGPKYNDFTPPRYWYVEPGGPIQFTKAVILLIHKYSLSAAENFTLAMRVLPHVTVVGVTTSGCFADVYQDKLPNGWSFSVSYKLFVDHEGFCWEGIGVPPDIHQTNTKEDIEQGHDRVLEFAIGLLNTGALQLQDENSSLQDIRESLAKNLGNVINEKGIESAVKAFYQYKAGDPDTYYIDEEELKTLGNQLIQSEKIQEAIEVLKIMVKEFPKSWDAYTRLGGVYLKIGNTNLAQENYKKALKLNPRQYPWEVFEYTRVSKVVLKPIIKLGLSKLRRLEGNYRINNGVIRVRVKDGELYRTFPSGSTGKLTPRSETEFTNPIDELYIFKLNKNGQPKGIEIHERTGIYYYPRVQ